MPTKGFQLDNNVITALIVSGGLAVKQVLDIVARRQTALIMKEKDAAAAKRLREQRDWDEADRREKNNQVLGAIELRSGEIRADVKQNTLSTDMAIAVGNNFSAKLLTMDQRLANLVNLNAPMRPADIGALLVDMKANLDAVEKYSHDWAHDYRNRIMKLEANASLKADGISELDTV